MAAGEAGCLGRETDGELRGFCHTRDRGGLEHRDLDASEGDSRVPHGGNPGEAGDGRSQEKTP